MDVTNATYISTAYKYIADAIMGNITDVTVAL